LLLPPGLNTPDGRRADDAVNAVHSTFVYGNVLRM
jgi:hypothetical protein